MFLTKFLLKIIVSSFPLPHVKESYYTINDLVTLIYVVLTN